MRGFLFSSAHPIEKPFPKRRLLQNRFPCDAKSSLFVAADSAGVPGPDFQIQRVSGKQRLRQFTGDAGHLLAIAVVTTVRIYADSKENFVFLLRKIDKADQRGTVIKRIEIVLGIGKAKASFFLLLIGRIVVDGVITGVVPGVDPVFFFFGGWVTGEKRLRQPLASLFAGLKNKSFLIGIFSIRASN